MTTVARGIVTAIRFNADETLEGVRLVRKGAQERCPRCHGTDTENMVPCQSCGVLQHAECLSGGCASFNCRTVTIPGTRAGNGAMFPVGVWGDAPEGWTVTVSERRVSHGLHGPNRLIRVKRSEWRRGAGYRGRYVTVECVEEERYAGTWVTWYHETVYTVHRYQMNGSTLDVELYDGEGDYVEDWRLTSEESLSEDYADYLRDADPSDYIDSHYLLEIAQEALSEGRTVDFEQVWESEIESLVDNSDPDDMARSLYCADTIHTNFELSEAFESALPAGVSLDILFQE